jgi:tRNA(fMet)-specific endonuclease VapC
VKYLLDTNHISIRQTATGPMFARLSARMAAYAEADFGLPVVGFHEQVLGAHAYVNRARKPAEVIRGYRMLLEVLDGYRYAQVVPFDAAAATAFDGFRGLRLGTGTMDLRIAAIALSRGLILLTQNVSDFAGIPGLVTEDWTA